MKILLAGRVENRKGFDLVISALPILEKHNILCEVKIVGATTPLVIGTDTISKYKKIILIT